MIEIFIPLTQGHRTQSDWLCSVVRQLREAGAPVSTRLRGWSHFGVDKAWAEYEAVIERGVVERIPEPGGDRFIWREE